MPSKSLAESFKSWNRKLHIYIGLYFLLFIWLFSISGLFLNHHWEFSRPQRERSKFERIVQVPTKGGDFIRARDLMAQLGLSGEIEWLNTKPEENRFDFRVTRPGKIINVRTDLKAQRATLEQVETNVWGVLNSLHQFTGVRMTDPKRSRDWFATQIWSVSMHAVCFGLVFLVLSSLYMWIQLKQKRLPGLLVVSLGVLCCGYFIFGLN